MALLQTLTDNFNDNSLNAVLWNKVEAGSVTVTEQNQRLEIALPASADATADGELQAATAYDFGGSYAYVKVVEMVSSATNADAFLRVYTDSNNWFHFVQEAGNLYYQYNKAGGGTQTVGSVVFDINTHTWWRLREAGGTVYWDTSTDGINWTNRASFVHGMDVSAMKAVVFSTCYQAETNPGNFIVDNFNTASLALKDMVPAYGVIPAPRA